MTQLQRTVFPRLSDDGSIESAITPARSGRPVDETPTGRAVGIEEDTRLVYLEIYELLTCDVIDMTPCDYETRLSDLMGALGDLGRRTDRAFEALMRARF